MRHLVLFVSFCLLSISLYSASQSNATKLTLKDCVRLAVEKNVNVQTANIEKEKTDAKKNEAKASLFPKVNFNTSMTDNLILPTTVLPGEFLGAPGTSIAVQMGSQYNASAQLSISQTLYNQTAITALKLAKRMEEVSALNIEKAREEVAVQVAKMYALAQVTDKQRKLIDSNIERSEHLKEITRVTVENGVGKQIELDRVNVNLENLYTQRDNTKAAQEQQMNTIKYLLAIPLDDAVELTDTIGSELLNSTPALMSDFSGNVNVRLLESQKQVTDMNKTIIKNGYLPTLSLSGQTSYQGLQNKFSNYFSSSSKWYPSAGLTLTLSVPVFDGFEKRSKSRQANLESKKAQLTLDNTKESLNMEFRNALNTYTNNKNNVSRQQRNLALAEKVYKETSLKYKEGVTTMTALIQDETSMNSAQVNYLTALYNFKDSELKIMSLNGEITSFIQK